MSKELIVNSSVHETRLALLEDDRLVELFIEQGSQYTLAGSIFKGRVARVLPGMQSAFVDIGLERDAFLYVSDFFEEREDIDTASSDPGGRGGESSPADEEGGGRENGEDEPAGAEAETDGRNSPLIAEKGAAGRGAFRRRGSRGRRSRRWRGRSSGAYAEPAAFPDEKYSSLSGSRQEEASKRAVEGAAPQEKDVHFVVLPGESLAKYGGEAPSAGMAEAGSSKPSLDAAKTALVEQEASSSEVGTAQSLDEPLVFRESELRGTPASSVVETAVANEDALPVSRRPSEPDHGESTGGETEKEAVPKELGDVGEAPDEERDDELSAGSGGAVEGAGARERDEAEARVPGRPLPADEKNGAGPSPSGAEMDSGRPGSEARHRTRPDRTRFQRRRGRRRGNSDEPAGNGQDAPPKISDLLVKGQEVLVQISKEPLGKKGARVTSHIALPGRFLVYTPTVNHTGVSRKIASDKERARLRRIVQSHNTGMPGGFIVRTAADGLSEENLRGDMQFLYQLWLGIREKSEHSPPGSLVHHDDNVVERVLRDRLGEDFKTIWVDGEEEYERILRFVERFQPSLAPAVKLYTREKAIFDFFRVSAEIEKSLRPKVWLKSGGYIVINLTEALVSIDVNTGKYVGQSDLEDTIVNTNLEAVKEIVRQVRIRGLGGIIVVDFIDMEKRANRQKVMEALAKELRYDTAPSKALPFNEFGLVAITRKRVNQSLERNLCSPCPYCQGASYVKSVRSVIYEILANARKIAVSREPKKDLTLRVNPEVARKLKSRDNRYLQEMEQILQTNVLVRGDVSLHRSHFDMH